MSGSGTLGSDTTTIGSAPRVEVYKHPFNPSVAYISSAVAGALGIMVGWVGFRKGRTENEFQHEQEADPEFATLAA